MKNVISAVILISCLTTPPVTAAEREGTTSAVPQEHILERVVVPTAESPQGEVQVIRRGETLIVRTLLASRVLKRVAAAIDAKEQRNWPEESDGFIASQRYRDELFLATERSWEVFRQRHDREESRQFLAIEFVCAGKSSEIVLSLPVLAGDYGHLQVLSQKLLTRWRTADSYARGNMIEIVKDSFRLDDAAAEALLAPHWPKG